jgi:phosphatidylinositol-3-phosphatase
MAPHWSRVSTYRHPPRTRPGEHRYDRIAQGRRSPLLALGLLLAGAGCGGSAPHPPPAAAPAMSARASPASSHVAVLVMENKERGDVVCSSSSRYVGALARRYAIATSSYAITHPSLPNYLALTSGSTQGITSDCTDSA